MLSPRPTSRALTGDRQIVPRSAGTSGSGSLLFPRPQRLPSLVWRTDLDSTMLARPSEPAARSPLARCPAPEPEPRAAMPGRDETLAGALAPAVEQRRRDAGRTAPPPPPVAPAAARPGGARRRGGEPPRRGGGCGAGDAAPPAGRLAGCPPALGFSGPALLTELVERLEAFVASDRRHLPGGVDCERHGSPPRN